MKNLAVVRTCCNCLQPIDERVSKYSVEHFDFMLCIPCQKTMQNKWNAATKHALSLYFLLKKKGIRAELEKCDGFKTIDIAITEARLNIEVDGSHHNTKHDQALADLQRTFYSFQKGYYTLRIPNSLVRNHLTETAEYVASFVEFGRKRSRTQGG
jgi:very-short-patch-repair endonuclease